MSTENIFSGFGKGTEVLTENCDRKKVENIVIGDKILNIDGVSKTCTYVNQDVDDMYQIIQEEGLDYVVSKDHVFCLYCTVNPVLNFYDEMYQIEHWDYYTKSVIRFSTSEYDHDPIKYVEILLKLLYVGTIIKISLKDYLSRSDEWKKVFLAYKTRINFAETIDLFYNPYFYGKTILSFPVSYQKIPTYFLKNSVKIRLSVLIGLLESNGEFINGTWMLKIFYDSRMYKDLMFLLYSIGLKCKKYGFNHLMILSGISTNNLDLKVSKTFKQIYRFRVQSVGRNKCYRFLLDNNDQFLLADCTVV